MKFLKNFANLSMTSVRFTVVSSFSHQFIIIIIIIIITFTMHHSISVPKKLKTWEHS